MLTNVMALFEVVADLSVDDCNGTISRSKRRYVLTTVRTLLVVVAALRVDDCGGTVSGGSGVTC